MTQQQVDQPGTTTPPFNRPWPLRPGAGLLSGRERDGQDPFGHRYRYRVHVGPKASDAERPDGIVLVPRLPTVGEYRYLLACVGWPVPPAEAAQVSLDVAVGGACALADGQIVGMGRLMSDGSYHCALVDLVVHPDRQRRGLGSALLHHLEGVAAATQRSSVLTMTAAPELVGFYERAGYVNTGSLLLRKSVRPPETQELA